MSPTVPQPTHDDDVAQARPRRGGPRCRPVGSMSATKTAASSDTPVGQRVEAAVGEGHPDPLGLSAVETLVDARVAEQRPVQALRGAAGAAMGARAAARSCSSRRPGRPARTLRDRRPDRLDDADELVAEDRAVLEARRVAVEREQVRAAEPGRRDPHDRVAGLDR